MTNYNSSEYKLKNLFDIKTENKKSRSWSNSKQNISKYSSYYHIKIQNVLKIQQKKTTKNA